MGTVLDVGVGEGSWVEDMKLNREGGGRDKIQTCFDSAVE